MGLDIGSELLLITLKHNRLGEVAGRVWGIWGMFIPYTAHVGIQGWEMEKESQGYPKVSLFTPESTKSSAESFFFFFSSGDSDPSFPQRHLSHQGEALEISSVPFPPL